MASDPELPRFVGSSSLADEGGQSRSGLRGRDGRRTVPLQHRNLVLHFVCELRESTLLTPNAFPQCPPARAPSTRPCRADFATCRSVPLPLSEASPPTRGEGTGEGTGEG